MKRILFCTLLVLSIQNSHNDISGFVASTIGNKVDDEGMSLDLPKQDDTYNFFSLESEMLRVPKASNELTPAINQQITLLKRKKPFKAKAKFTGLKLSEEELRRQLLKTAKKLKTWNQKGDDVEFFEEFELYRINGFDQKGNIEFTAYYTPVFEVNTVADDTYQYPIVKITSIRDTATNQLLTNTLWAKKPNTAASIRMQGSAFVQYANGKQELLSYQPQTIPDAKLPKGDTATTRNIFVKLPNRPMGSTGATLMPSHSIAVDPRYIPYGSCLLSAVPVIDAKGQFIRHEYKLLFAQDTGSFIKGMHVDYYCGVGTEAEHRARYMKHFGKMWLVLAKDTKEKVKS